MNFYENKSAVMKTRAVQEPINLKVVRFELDFMSLTPSCPTQTKPEKKSKDIRIPREIRVNIKKKRNIPPPPVIKDTKNQKRNIKDLVEELLDELYADQRDWSSNSGVNFGRGSTSEASITSSQTHYDDQTDVIERVYLEDMDIYEIRDLVTECEERLKMTGERLARHLRARDRLRRQQKRLCAAFTILLRHITGESGARFGVAPAPGEGPGEGGYAEWLHAMRLVARLPAGVPQHFRKKLWLTLADRHLNARGIEWPAAERGCFRGTAMPDDEELGAQILKDLHRTGCSLFCGTEGRENQAMLRRVLLAYARWNKDVGYCQGFNMLAAIILEVMEKSESDSLKVMIYLVEAVLPEGYFADDLRGLSADMAAFRDLLRLRLPRLANHMDNLQRISDGGGVEPPLPDVFTMQWFLTLYATWLPRESLLRIWDLILLDGNEILLLTALAIWDMLQDRILSARSADEFYSCMGGGVGAVWEAGEALVARVVAFGSVPELPRLRSLHRYRVAPPAPPTTAPNYHPPLQSAVQSMTKRGLRLFYSEDEGDSSDDGNKMALATIAPRRETRSDSGTGDRLSLDIGALKRQYARLRERQRQAHVILAAACARHAAVGVPTSPTSLTVNNLLLGKSAIVSSRGRRLGPPPGAIPPSRQTDKPEKTEPSNHYRSDTISWKEEKSRKSLSRRNSVKWKDIKKEKIEKIYRKASIDLDETGDGVIVSELEANQMIASLRSRSSSETSSYSSHSASSTDTSLCDEQERGSDSEQDLPNDDVEKHNRKEKPLKQSTLMKDSKIVLTPVIKESAIVSNVASAETEQTEKPVKDISEYLDTAAGEPLRTYIDGFETMLKDNSLVISSPVESFKPISPFKAISPCTTPRSPRISTESEVLQRLSKTRYDENSKSNDSIRPTNPPSVQAFTELSPVDLSPCHYGLIQKSPYDFNFTSDFRLSSPKPDIISRPPDIIDSLTMYPNFVPDIDLSEKNISDIESPPRSPGAESIIVSEDEPPIPLKIDKYFEHSPEFFGARVTDANNLGIPNRRSTKRNSRIPRKPDSLTLQSSHNDKIAKEEAERASSLPQSHSFNKTSSSNSKERDDDLLKSMSTSLHEQPSLKMEESSKIMKERTPDKNKDFSEMISPKDYILSSGRKNSERALQIIQENSKILSRILTKQNITEVPTTRESLPETRLPEVSCESLPNYKSIDTSGQSAVDSKQIESPLLKESTSDSLIGYRKKSANDGLNEKNDFIRVRPISIDDPFSLDIRNISNKEGEFPVSKNVKTPSIECLVNKTDLYGWENKGFLAKYDYKVNTMNKPDTDSNEFDYRKKTCDVLSHGGLSSSDFKPATTSDWTRQSFSGESKTSVTLPSTEPKDTSSYDRKYVSDDYNYPFSSKYNDYVLSKASDICSKTVDQGPKVCENVTKTDNSQVSDFAHVVTSSISFTYEPSGEDDSPIGAKSNSSDTLCQITSLDQVSTPISPKIFPKETPTLPKEYFEKSERTKFESDDTCSAITSLIETDTLSSLSYPRSPSTGSYHPFPTRPAMRMPKELGVRLGMYPKDVISSPPK